MPSRRSSRASSPPPAIAEPLPPHRPSRRAELVRAATRVFSESPLSTASVEQIAAECGLSVTAVYYHFNSKEQLFDEAHSLCLDSLGQCLSDPGILTSVTGADASHEFVEAWWGWLRAHPTEARLLTLHTWAPTLGARSTMGEWETKCSRTVFSNLRLASRQTRTRGREKDIQAASLLGFRYVDLLIKSSHAAWLDERISEPSESSVVDALATILRRTAEEIASSMQPDR